MLIHTSTQPRKNYQGRSFKNRDLTGQDFSFADIRGADFTGANLTGAKFNYTLAGLTKSQKIRHIYCYSYPIYNCRYSSNYCCLIFPQVFSFLNQHDPIPIPVGAVIFIFLEFVNISILIITIRQSIQKIIGYLFSVIPIIMVIISILAALGIGEENAREWYTLLGKFLSFLGITEAQFVVWTGKLRYFRFNSIAQNLNDNGSIEIIVSFIICVFAIFVLIFTLSLAVALAEIIAEKWLGYIAVTGAGILAVIA
ncbi:pentapeptide repeat-containing protein, partial [Okeania sp. KiyG1]|uniref:pentapeptide repeat-containing protein n=1 Tax=Okeania sp. KiyG1 TaxID=2720165 RepID=UPI001921EECA